MSSSPPPELAHASGPSGGLAPQAAEPASGASGASGSAFPGDALAGLLAQLAVALRSRGQMLATAESCTGGLIAAACTELAGSSDWFDRGVVSYSNEAKQALLGVPAGLLQAHGAVSEPVARAMAGGLLARAPAQVGVAVTGIAGPGGGSPNKPVGLVWLAWSWRDAQGAVQTSAESRQFAGDRQAVRRATVQCALEGVLQWSQQGRPPGQAPGDAPTGAAEPGAGMP